MTALHAAHPFVLELGARVLLGEGREKALRAAETIRVPPPVLYRAVHLMERTISEGRSPWGVVWDAYILDGKMNGNVLIDSNSHDLDAIRLACLRFYGLDF